MYIRFLFSAILITSVVSFAQTGIVKSYHLNGQKSAEISYSDGIYDGTSYWYYKNGNLKEVKTFSNGKVNGWVRSYYESGLLKEEMYVEDGRLDGIAKSYYANGALESILTYENGFLVKSQRFEYDQFYQAPIEDYQAGNMQQKSKKKSEEEFLCDVKICPEPLGGMESIYKKLTYPTEARAYGLEGKVKLVVKINTDGKVIDSKVISGIGLGCDEAAIDAIKATRFLPGQNNEGPVVSSLTLNVEFKLDEDSQLAAAKRRETPKTESVAAPEIGIADRAAVPNKRSEPDEEQVIEEVKPTPQLQPEKVITRETKSKDETKIKDAGKVEEKKYFTCSEVDVCAKPKGGIDAVLKNLTIPKAVKENNVKGVVIVLCEVNKRGKVRNTLVKKGLPEGANVAVEVALIYTKFEPALKDGEAVDSKVTVTVPIEY